MVERTLYQRMYDYLKKKEDWVPKGTLVRLARSKGYSHDLIRSALWEIDHTIEIGTAYVSKADAAQYWEKRVEGEHYHWYPITEEEKRLFKEQDEAFEAL